MKLEQRKENKMGTMPVSKLLLTMSLPIMISMLVQAMYNIVDSVFVAQYSANGLTAVSLAFPVQNLMIAVGVGTSIGVNSLLSRKLGERHFDDANAAAENGLMLAVLSAIAFAVFGAFCSRMFFQAFTQNEQILEMGTQYLTICTTLSFGAFIQLTSERILQATGKTFWNMISQGVGAIINIILDPIMIFGLLGFPELGVAGAALATVIGQWIAMGCALFFNFKFNHEVHINFRKFRPNWRIVGEIYQVGIPSIVMQSIASIMTFGVNKILIPFTEVAVSVFGVYFKLQSFIFMPVFGVTSGMVPIVGYNFGVGKKERIIHTIKDACIYAVALMGLGLVVFQLFPAQLISIFSNGEELGQMLEIGVPALRIISISFIGAGIAIVFSSVFQAIGNGILSLIMSVIRQLVVLLPAAWLLSKIGLSMVWWSFPIAEIFSTGLALLMYRSVYRKMIQPLVPIDEQR